MNIKNVIITCAAIAAMMVPACAADVDATTSATIPQGTCLTSEDGLWHTDGCNAHRYNPTDEEWQMVLSHEDTDTEDVDIVYSTTTGMFKVNICTTDGTVLATADYNVQTGVVSNVNILVSDEEFKAAGEYMIHFVSNTEAGVLNVKMTSTAANLEITFDKMCQSIATDYTKMMTLENSSLYYNPQLSVIRCQLDTDMVDVSITTPTIKLTTSTDINLDDGAIYGDLTNSTGWYKLTNADLTILKNAGLVMPSMYN